MIANALMVEFRSIVTSSRWLLPQYTTLNRKLFLKRNYKRVSKWNMVTIRLLQLVSRVPRYVLSGSPSSY